MKKFFTLLFTIFSLTAFTQVTINTSDTLSTLVPAASTDVVGYGLVKNEASTLKTYRWTRNVINITSGWQSAVCDKNQCFLPNVSTMTFDMAGGEEGTMDVHVYPSGTDGSAFIEVLVEDAGNNSNNVTGFYNFDSNLTNNQNVIQSTFKVYPNPSNGLFTIEGDQTIQEVVIYNTSGRLIKRFQYNNTAEWFDINELPKGTYMLHLIGEDNVSLSSKLISKL